MRDKTILIIVAGVIVILYILQVIFQQIVISEGFEYWNLLEQIRQQKQQNLLLYDQILQHESLQTINQEARNMGFIDANYFVL